MQTRWTTQETNFLITNYITKTNVELATLLYRSISSVVQKLIRLQLKRPPAARSQRSRQYGVIGQFKCGSIPWNKNKKGIHPSPATEFKPGHLPVNTKYDGCITIRVHKRTGRPYYWIRQHQSCWIMYHQYLWEQVNGPIPPGCFLRFKDNNTLNLALDNLLLVNRRQHADLNRNPAKASQSLKRRWQESRWLTDKFSISCLAHRHPELRDLIAAQPDLIELHRNNLKLKLELKQHEPDRPTGNNEEQNLSVHRQAASHC
jgi:hypothetical protein